MNRTMTSLEVNLARRIIGLRGTRFTATKNSWRRTRGSDFPTIWGLHDKGHAELVSNEENPLLERWHLTPQGIQQLKLQIGEFSF